MKKNLFKKKNSQPIVGRQRSWREDTEVSPSIFCPQSSPRENELSISPLKKNKSVAEKKGIFLKKGSGHNYNPRKEIKKSKTQTHK